VPVTLQEYRSLWLGYPGSRALLVWLGYLGSQALPAWLGCLASRALLAWLGCLGSRALLVWLGCLASEALLAWLERKLRACPMGPSWELRELPAADHWVDRLKYFRKAFRVNLSGQALALRAKRFLLPAPRYRGAILRVLPRKMFLALRRRQNPGTERAPGIQDAHRALSGSNRTGAQDHLSG
jgi:hypothetical protein